MWRKMHSNRDPRDTLYSEIRKEFGGYFTATGNALTGLLNAYPKIFLVLMIFLMIISGALSFTVFRHPDTKATTAAKPVNPVSDGFSNILQTASRIKDGLHLKKVIDSLSTKKQLSAADSSALERALDSLQQIQN